MSAAERALHKVGELGDVGSMAELHQMERSVS
jgi:hypothetical protein